MTPTLVSNNSLNCVATCSTKTILRYNHFYTSPEESANLKAGTAAHEALAVYFKGGTPKEALKAFRLAYKEWAQANIDPSDRYMGRLSYENTRLILKYWMERTPLDAFPFEVAPEHVEVELRYPLTKSGDLVFRGRLDAGPVIARQGGAVGVLDHKTSGRLDSSWADSFRLDSQLTGYIWGVQQHMTETVENGYINAIEFSKLPGLEDPTRKCRDPQHGGVTYEECQHLHVKALLVGPISRTQPAVRQWKRDAIRLGRRLEELKEAYADLGALPKAPMEGTFTQACKYCEFKSFCQTGRQLDNLDRMLVVDEERKGKDGVA